MRVFDERLYSVPALIANVRRHCVRHGTQVLHTHGYKENVIGSAVRLTRHSLRTLRTEHGAAEPPPGGLSLKGRMQKLVDRICAHCIQWPVVTVSHPLAEQWGRWVPPSRVRVVENGVLVAETERRAATPVTLQSDGRRRQDRLLRPPSHGQASGPDPPCRMVCSRPDRRACTPSTYSARVR